MISSVELGSVGSFIRGITFKPHDVVEPGTPGSVVCMRTKNVQADLDQRDLIAIPRAFVKREEQMLNRGDLLVSSANSWELVGKCCWIPQLDYQATAGGFITIFRPNSKIIDDRFLYHWFSSATTQTELRYCGRQTTNISNLSIPLAEKLPIPLPPLAEQKRIAAILDKADEIRRKREKAIELTDSFLRSVFLEMFGDPVTNPKGWDQAPFSSLLLRPLRNGVSPSSKGTYRAKVLTLAAITGDAFCSEAVKEGLFETEPRAEKLVDPSDFLICRGNGNLDLVGRGKFCFAQDETLVFPDTMIAACIDQSKILPSYLNLLWNSRCIRGQLERSARTTNGTYKVNQTAIEGILVLLPPFKMQKRFAEVCQAANNYRKRIESASHISAALASSLASTFLAGGYLLENGEGPHFVEREAHALQL